MALGHIHAAGRFGAGAGMCAWPGCAMGRGFDETGTKGLLIAEVGETTELRFLPLDVPRFFEDRVAPGDDPVDAVGALLPPGGSRDHFRIHLIGEVRPGVLDRLREKFSAYPNLTLLDETVILESPWKTAGEDSLTGLFFRVLQDAAQEADPETAAQLELAARIGRRILDGREVELP